jgi:hypothetical protein
VGVILDGRGRPLDLPASEAERMAKMEEWTRAVGAMPGERESRVESRE